MSVASLGRTETLLERAVRSDYRLRVDRGQKVIRNVKILGRKSLNKREYLPEAIAAARHHYEGISVNFDHPPKHNPDQDTPIDRRAGWVENVRVVSDGLICDYHYLTDPRNDKIAEAAERRPELFGFSHNVEGKTRRESGRTLVEEITRVRSVDLVTDPASTRSLFESENRKGKAMRSACARDFVESITGTRRLRELVDDEVPVETDDELPAEESDEIDDVLTEKIKAILRDTSLSPEEKVTRIKELFGISSTATATESRRPGRRSANLSEFCRAVTGRGPSLQESKRFCRSIIR